MKSNKTFKSYLEKYGRDPEFQAERLIIDLTEQIAKRLEDGSLTRSELAKRLKCSNAYITKLMRGEQNLTIRTIVQIANALDCTLDFSFVAKGSVTFDAFLVKKTEYDDFHDSVKPCDTCEGIFAAAA